MIQRRSIARCLLGLVLGLGCAEASAPLPPPEEVLLVVSQGPAELRAIPVDAPTTGVTIPLGDGNSTPEGVSARAGWALVPLGSVDSVAIVDLRARAVARMLALEPGSGATGSAIVDDSIAYVGNPGLNSVTRINYLTGDTSSVAVGVWPQALVFTRGRLFVLNGNLVGGVPDGPSWVSVIDPATNRPATGIDSILMPGPGNAAFGAVAADGLLYVMNVGPDDSATAGRLTLIDPVGRSELGSFGGFGAGPGAIAADGIDRLYVSSRTEGVMLFDFVTRKLARGAGNAIAIPTNTAVTVDSRNRLYAVEGGPCTPGASGTIHVLRRSLAELRTIPGGACPVASLISEIPPL